MPFGGCHKYLNNSTIFPLLSSVPHHQSPPTKPKRLYLPLSLSDWDLRIRKERATRRMQQQQTTPNPKHFLHADEAEYNSGSNNEIMTSLEIDIYYDCGSIQIDETLSSHVTASALIVPISSKRKFSHPNAFGTSDCEGNEVCSSSMLAINDNNRQHSSAMMDDRISIGSAVSAPVFQLQQNHHVHPQQQQQKTKKPYRSKIANKLVNRSQSFAKILSTFRLRSRSTTRPSTPTTTQTETSNFYDNDEDKRSEGKNKKSDETEEDIDDEWHKKHEHGIPALGEHTAWLRSRGIFVNGVGERQLQCSAENGTTNDGTEILESFAAITGAAPSSDATIRWRSRSDGSIRNAIDAVMMTAIEGDGDEDCEDRNRNVADEQQQHQYQMLIMDMDRQSSAINNDAWTKL